MFASMLQKKWPQIKRGSVIRLLPVAGLMAMLLVLTVLQFSWSVKISEAERDRLQRNLQLSIEGFHAVFAHDLLGICRTFQIAAGPLDSSVLWNRLFDRYADWRRISGHPALIQDLYIVSSSNGQSGSLDRLDPETRRLASIPWPNSLGKVRLWLTGDPDVHAFLRQPGHWLWDEQSLTLVHPLYGLPKSKTGKRAPLLGYLLVVLSPERFAHIYLPELGRRYFPQSNGFIFQVVERTGQHHQLVAYQSDGHLSADVFTHPDAVIGLLDGAAAYRSTGSVAAPGNIANAIPNPVLKPVTGNSNWQIAIRNRSGSVDTAVKKLRWRNLAVSAAVLAVLVLSLITILISTRRAQRLAQLQMEFASGVSHELRTPLAVISSAAENLADGVIKESSRIREYGTLIHSQGRRLEEMVEHILNFARLKSTVHTYRKQPVDVKSVINDVLINTRPLLDAEAMMVKADVPDGLPLLFADSAALGQCLENLLSNAIKYGRDGGRILLLVSKMKEHGGDRVLICVKDFGAGIAPADLPQIFDPFYRGGNARNSQTRGSGLGLSLTKEMMEGMGGRVTAESSPGKGSTFTLHVPIASAESSKESAF